MMEQIEQMQEQMKGMEDMDQMQDRLPGLMRQAMGLMGQVSLKIEQQRAEMLGPDAAAAEALHAGTPIRSVIRVRPGKAPWLAPWMAGLIVERLLERNGLNDRGRLGLDLTAALLGRDADKRQYRRCRKALKGEPVFDRLVRNFGDKYQLIAGLGTRDLEHRCQVAAGLETVDTPLRLRWPDHWQVMLEDHLQVPGVAATFPFDVKIARALYAAYRSDAGPERAHCSRLDTIRFSRSSTLPLVKIGRVNHERFQRG